MSAPSTTHTFKTGGVGVIASGTTNTVAKYTGGSTLGNSSITDNGTTVVTTEAFNQGTAAANSYAATGVPTKLEGITTAGLAYPILVASPALATGLVSANTNFINYTPPAAAGDYLIMCEIDITTSTSYSFTVVVTFTDSNSVARTQTLGVFSPAGLVGASGAISSITWVAGHTTVVPLMFSIDNSATAITLSTSGTFTTVTYNLGARLYKV